MKIEREKFRREVFEEIRPLAQKCWDESTAFKGETCAYHGQRDFKVEPDFDSYNYFDKHDWLILVTMREEGDLKGYVVGLLHQSMHHKGILCGLGDSIYIEPEYRQHTWALITRFEKELAEAGAAIIGWPVHRNGPVFDILKSRGYVEDDVVMEKMLCASQQQSSAVA